MESGGCKASVLLEKNVETHGKETSRALVDKRCKKTRKASDPR